MIRFGVCSPLPEGAKVNRRGWTTPLWTKSIFGFCGELWWILGFRRPGSDLPEWIFGISGVAEAIFWVQKRGESVVVRCRIVVVRCRNLKPSATKGKDEYD